MMKSECAFQEFAGRASRLTPNSTTEEIDAVFAGATEGSLSEFDTARLLCLTYGYSGVFVKAPISYLGLLTKAFDLPTANEIQPTRTTLATLVSYKGRRRRYRSPRVTGNRPAVRFRTRK
jgi:hypothetical protein